MSRGPGRTERFVLREVTGVDPEVGEVDPPAFSGVPLLSLAQGYADERGVRYTERVLESVRRAVHNLYRQGLVSTGYDWIPSGLQRRPGLEPRTHSGRWRKMLLVGPPGTDEFGPFADIKRRDPWGGGFYSSPQRSPGRKVFPRLVYPERCVDCDTELLGGDGMTEDTILRVSATVILMFWAEDEPDRGIKIERSDLCYGCWLDRNPDLYD